ncbi:hypothetical protein GCM10020254_73060 [Streptomyces goshikiensis]
MRDAERPAVRGEQPAGDERVRHLPLGGAEFVPRYAPARRLVPLHGDQPQQHLHDRVGALPGARAEQRRVDPVGLTDQRARDPAGLPVVRVGEGGPGAAGARVQLLEGVREQREGVAAAAVVDDPGHQARLEGGPGRGRRPGHHLVQGVPPEGADQHRFVREFREVGLREPGQEVGPERADEPHLRFPAQQFPYLRGERRPLPGPRQRQQFLQLVHHQHERPRPPGLGDRLPERADRVAPSG